MPTTSGHHWRIVGTVCIGAFMAALDASIVNVALPAIRHTYDAHLNAVEWVAIAYLLTLTALLPVLGRLADMLGRSRLYTIGFAIFAVGSFLCGRAGSLDELVIFRIMQAVGAVLLQANSVAIITAATPSAQRGKAIGIQAASQAAGLSFGPIIGGLLVDHFGWPAVFLVNVPVGAIGITMALLMLPKDSKSAKLTGFDFRGSAILTATLVFGLLSLTESRSWALPVVLGMTVLTLFLLYSFVRAEKATNDPLVRFELFRNRRITVGTLTGLFSYTLMYGTLFLVPFYVSLVSHGNALQAGLSILPIPVSMALISPIAGTIQDRIGYKLPTVIGMAALTVGVVGLGFMLWLKIPLLFPFLIVAGIGIGLFNSPNNTSVMSASPSNMLSLVGGVLNMARSFGMSFGVALAGAIYGMFAPTDRMGFLLACLALALTGLISVVLEMGGHEPSVSHALDQAG